ncbi:MAG TPA: hypothetical protein VGZ47_01335 [Gemmataceae bacterium]|jgi:hypothetical protein|nr:hypothetical protein [Gemmataceae bacterium]
MSAGTMILASLLWAAGALPSDVTAMNRRTIQIPIQINPDRGNDIAELLLFVSMDQGKNWTQEGRARPGDQAFSYYAPMDGLYWFQMCVVFKNGQREPMDLNQMPPGLKVYFDTVPPVLRIRSAERIGDEIAVSWEGQEAQPDLASLKLEYRPAGDSSAPWNMVPIQNPGMMGSQRFRVNTTGALSIRISIEDLAKNQAQAQKVIPAVENGSSVVASRSAPVMTVNNSLPPAPITSSPGPMLTTLPDSPPPVNPPTNYQPANRYDNPPLERQQNSPNGVPIASSQTPPQRDSYGQPTGYGQNGGVQRVASNSLSGSTPARSELKNVQLINSAEINLAYEVSKSGASGLRSVKLYMTQNDGLSWMDCAEAKDLVSPINAQLPGEGVYGFRLVLESGAGLSKGPPVSGDAPEIRVEVDTTPPQVELYQLAPDPNLTNAVILRWSASDKNMAPNPITLEWAENPDGPWQAIATGIANSSTYNWKLPPKMPVRVYLRVLARDLAGNIGEARTGTPQLIDMTRPEGHIKGIVGTRVMERP